MPTVRREARKLVDQLTLPSPWAIADVCSQVGCLRGREVVVEQIAPDLAGSATAAVRREAERDVITYRADHHGADQLIAHELGHLLAGDLDGAPDLTNAVSSDVREAVLTMQRSCAYDDRAESLAEAVADLIMAGARSHTRRGRTAASPPKILRGFGGALR